jgi:hypothetical protein
VGNQDVSCQRCEAQSKPCMCGKHVTGKDNIDNYRNTHIKSHKLYGIPVPEF